MGYETLINKLRVILTNEEINRLSEDMEYQSLIIDLHGLTRKEADRLVNNIISVNMNQEFKLILIHGYVHGIELKRWITSKPINPRVIKSKSPAYNPGRTILNVAA